MRSQRYRIYTVASKKRLQLKFNKVFWEVYVIEFLL